MKTLLRALLRMIGRDGCCALDMHTWAFHRDYGYSYQELRCVECGMKKIVSK